MPGWGELALGSLLLALVSGFILIPFIPAGDKTFVALSELIGSGFFGHFIHSFHSWSGDVFLITTFIHIIEYLYKKTFLSYQLVSWFWLVLLLVFSVLTVFSGFLSLASQESLSAVQIFTSILSRILIVGDFFILFLFGDLQSASIYLHHASTFSIITVILVYVHLQRIKSERYAFIYAAAVLTFLAVLFPARIGHAPDTVNQVVKGPWYFIGLQEMLGWMPVWLAGLVIPGGLLVLFGFLPNFRRKSQPIIWLIILFILFYLIEAVIGQFLRGSGWQLLLR